MFVSLLLICYSFRTVFCGRMFWRFLPIAANILFYSMCDCGGISWSHELALKFYITYSMYHYKLLATGVGEYAFFCEFLR